MEATQVMKHKSLRDKFRTDTVQPLYKKVKPKNVSVLVHSSYNLDGQNFNVERKIDVVKNTNKTRITLPGVCEGNKVNNKVYILRNNVAKMIDAGNSSVERSEGKFDKNIQAEKVSVPHNFSDTWLRVYPLPQLEKESVCSTLFRCIACQLGLATILVLWTLVWVFVIHSFEGPFELEVSKNFESEQNQLVIDLATELRQITPLSPKWREAIEKRIQDERQLTILAVGRGAKAHPGQFWDLPGTFLFTIYVMTALGFGAPVPQTTWGRSAALIYAFIAVPTHIYLMVNASTCSVAKCNSPCRWKNKSKRSFIEEVKNTTDSTRESPNCSRTSEVMKASKCSSIRNKIMRCFRVLIACRCVPAAAILYCVCGAVAFGVVRGRNAIETVMFPLEFTTTGGLEHVLGHVRILYGLYIEGAMMLLSYALATLRRRSTAAVDCLALKYRLFQIHV